MKYCFLFILLYIMSFVELQRELQGRNTEIHITKNGVPACGSQISGSIHHRWLIHFPRIMKTKAKWKQYIDDKPGIMHIKVINTIDNR